MYLNIIAGDKIQEKPQQTKPASNKTFSTLKHITWCYQNWLWRKAVKLLTKFTKPKGKS